MRFNDHELLRVAEGSPVIEGILQYMKPQANDWSDWYVQPAFKERIFKLVNNLLFYFRLDERKEPLGVLVLENMQVAYESPGPAFAFSLMFSDGKHIFSCRCQEDVNKWVAALKVASYEYWRSLYSILQARINMKMGKDPMLNYGSKKPESNVRNVVVTRVSKSKFYSSSETVSVSSSLPSSSETVQVSSSGSKIPVENLIDL